MGKAYDIQKGTYNNWFPIGYSVFLTIPMQFGKNYIVARTIMQLLLYSNIPVLVFLVLNNLFKLKKSGKVISLIGSVLFCFYPYYVISSLWEADTWPIFLITILGFYLFLQLKDGNIKKVFLLGLVLGLLFFFRPTALVPFLILILISAYNGLRHKNLKVVLYGFVVFIPIILTIAGWGLRNYKISSELCLSQSNAGYNLWLGNNAYTNVVLHKRFGDATPIEEDIIPFFDKKWSFLKNSSEYEKDNFFKGEAINFIKTHPSETITNSMWKFVGFWSPFRMREGHWSDSKVKSFLTILFAAPLLFLSMLSIIWFIIKKDYKKNKDKLFVISFIVLWMLPYLLYFSTFRYRTPIDFLLLYLALDLIYPFLYKFKFLVEIYEKN